MTINQQIEAIFSHPYYKLAFLLATEGDDTTLRHLFFEVMFHTYEKCTLNARKTYGKNRWMEQTCKIMEEIALTAPPENLDMRFRTPFARELKRKDPKRVRKTEAKIIPLQEVRYRALATK